MSLRVLKLGGSLLDLPELAARLGRWLDRQERLAGVMIVGGGALVDAIRAADRTHALGEAAAHALCLQTMGVTAALAHQIFAGSRLRTELRQIDRLPGSPLQILDVRELLAESGRPPQSEIRPEQVSATALALPESWQVTSDSIAAYVAGRLEADELVLLKSALPTAGVSPQELADSGLVDEYFPHALGRFEVRIVNLRDPECRECRLALTRR